MGVIRRLVTECPRRADTKNPDRNVEARKPDAGIAAVPSRHGDARQALGELRRILNAEWHRIRGNIV
jgi:hypothetical protein